MSKRAYVASGESEDGAFAVVLAAALAAGILAGVIEGYVSQWFSLLVLFPLGIGAAAGGVAASLVASRKMRAPALAFIAACLGGLLGQMSVSLVQYAMFRSAMIERFAEPVEADEEADPDEVAKWQALTPEQRFDRGILETAGRTGIVGWYMMNAEEGTEIKRHGSGTKVSGLAFHILTGVELMLAAGLGGWIAFTRARQPFCEHCKRWYDGDEVVFSCSGEKEAVARSVDAIERAEMARAVEESQPPTEKRVLLFQVTRCTQCLASDPLLTLKLVVNPSSNKPQVSEKWASLIRSEELAEITRAARAKA